MGNSSSGQDIPADDSVIPPPNIRPIGRVRPKVLPDLSPAPRLRLTDNGVILHNGGTISTKKLERQKLGLESDSKEFRRDFYGSEPDLRFTGRMHHSGSNESPSKLRISRSKKKYKAPQIPHRVSGDSSSPDSYQEWENSAMEAQPSRRLRLFKTKAETRKKIPENHLPNYNNYLPPSGALHRSLSTPQFHAELLEIAEKLRPVREPPVGKSAESPSISPVSGFRSLETEKKSDVFYGRHSNKTSNDIRPKAEGCSAGEMPSAQESWMSSAPKTSAPVKSFYFGMDMSGGDPNESATIEKFAARLQHLSLGSSDGRGSPCLDSYSDIDENKAGISVQLRATLPRKQLDIPRFSPTTAWRQLSNIEAPTIQHYEEDDVVHLEERLLPPPPPIHIPALLDKSADSGISGDASPHNHDSTHNSQAAWTPQQDLEETSSDGGYPNGVVSDNCATAKFSPRFTLSLPRDDRGKIYSFQEKDEAPKQPSSSHSLTRLKRSVSGALGKGPEVKEEANESSFLDSNWVLSRSVPNSLNVPNLLQKWNDENEEQEDEDITTSLTKQPSFSYLASGGHIMYLPEYSKPCSSQTFSKSCEDLSRISVAEETLPSPEPIEVPKVKREKKFTFQSTVRQIERKRLAAQLSKQAEHKERERRSELEAMRKVEEEFQRKREREKADIRQQLRLYSITQNKKKSSSPDPTLPSTQVLSEFRQQQREYREYRPQRRPGNGSESPVPKETSSIKATVHPQVVCQIPKNSHSYAPRLTSHALDKDSNNSSNVNDNYRKHFAHGGFHQSLGSSDSEMSMANNGTPLQNRTPFPWTEELFKDSRTDENSVQEADVSLGYIETNSFMFIPPSKTNDKCDNSVNDEENVPSDYVPPLRLTVVQPFIRGKTYRPITFNPKNQVSQFAS